MVLTYVLIQGWTIDPYKHWLFYQPGEVLLLPTHYAEIFKWGSMTCGVAVVMYGAFRCSLYLSKCSWCFSNVLLITFQPITFEPVNCATLFCYVVFIFWCHQFIFQGLSTLKVHLYAIFLPMFLKLSLSPLLYGTVMEFLLMLLLLLFLLLLLDVFGVLFFNFILFMAHDGYLQADKTVSMCINSSSSWSWLEQMFFALCSNELITLYLLAMAWWLSHCKYWLVWVGFLYIEVDRLTSLFAVIKVSRKGIDPSALVFSTVNCIFSSMAFMCWRNSSLCSVSKMTKVSSTNLLQWLVGCGCFQGLLFQSAPYIYWPLWGWVVTPLLHLLLVHNIAIGKQNMCFWGRIPKAWWCAWWTGWFSAVGLYLWWVFLLWSFRAGGIGTDVKSAVTS